jgi:hypothetical protein
MRRRGVRCLWRVWVIVVDYLLLWIGWNLRIFRLRSMLYCEILSNEKEVPNRYRLDQSKNRLIEGPANMFFDPQVGIAHR